MDLADGTVDVFASLDADTLHGNYTGECSPGPEFVAIQYDLGGILLKLPYDGSPPVEFAAYKETSEWIPANPITVGTDIFFTGFHNDRLREYVHRTKDDSRHVLLEPADVDVVGFTTDGKTMAWLQFTPPKGSGKPLERIELWTSPFALSASALVPEKVAEIPKSFGNFYTKVEGGLVWLRESARNRNIVIRLEDRTFWDLVLPDPEHSWGDLLYLAPDEIVLPVATGGFQFKTQTIRRQRFDGLPPPQPLASLKPTPGAESP